MTFNRHKKSILNNTLGCVIFFVVVLFVFVLCLVCPMLQATYRCLWIVHSWLPLRFSLTQNIISHKPIELYMYILHLKSCNRSCKPICEGCHFIYKYMYLFYLIKIKNPEKTKTFVVFSGYSGFLHQKN